MTKRPLPPSNDGTQQTSLSSSSTSDNLSHHHQNICNRSSRRTQMMNIKYKIAMMTTTHFVMLLLLLLSSITNAFVMPSDKRIKTTLHSSSSSSSPNEDPNNKNLSASSRARREEDRRRLLRRNENIPGKTSAVPSATDYILNPSATEQLWLSQASNIEVEISQQTDLGMKCLKNLKIEEANDAFERVYQLKPNAYLWQAGIVQFYLDNLNKAQKTFEENAMRYESKFGEPASEEKIWRDACELKIVSGMKRGEKKKERVELYRQRMEMEEERGVYEVSRETRKVIRIARDLFSASVANDLSTVALSRAKLRSICGEYGSPPTRLDRKMWRLSSWYYLGLHYDALGEEEDSKACMKMALRQCFSTGDGNDIIHTLPVIHMSRRDWYDDEEFVEDLEERENTLRSVATLDQLHKEAENTPSYKWSFSGNNNDGAPSNEKDSADSNGKADERKHGLNIAMSGVNPIILESIQDSVDKMKLTELQDALRKKGLKTSGSKSLLQERLMYSLLEDEGLSGLP